MIPHTMYNDIERQLMPMIRRKAARLRGFMDMDDAIQEARLVLFRALQSYDYNRQPDLERYVGVCLNNAFAGQYNKATAQCRMPRRPALQTDGSYAKVPTLPASMDMEPQSQDQGPECVLESSMQKVDVDLIIGATEALLSERERDVLLCFLQPPPGVKSVPGDSGFNLEVAAYLGMTKNMIDWTLHRVRQALLEVFRFSEFSEGIGKLVGGPGWPHLSHSPYWADTDMLEWTISDRGLDGKVRSEERQGIPGAERWSIVYDWGEALFLRFGETAASLVMEGRFNPVCGILFGSQHGSQAIPVPWYQRCMRAVNGT